MSVQVNDPHASVSVLLRTLKLSTMQRHSASVTEQASREGWSFTQYLKQLCELELIERTRRRVERNLQQSQLSAEKTLAALNTKKLSARCVKMLPTLCEGSWVTRGDNLLLFGLPGRGKTHMISAIGHELVQRGHKVLFVATYALVQQLLLAKRELRLEKELTELDRFELIILDDIGYVQQNRDEMEVLFTFLAERYERRSVAITSNLVFSEWNRIFKDPMTTAAAIDRLVHHAVIIEMSGGSIREEIAAAALQTMSSSTCDNLSTTTTETQTSPSNDEKLHPELDPQRDPSK